MTSIPSDKRTVPYHAPDLKIHIPRTKEKHFAKIVASPPGAPTHEDHKVEDLAKKALKK